MLNNFLGSSQKLKPNTIRSIEHLAHKKALIKNSNGIVLTDNICLHRQAIMVQGEQNYHNTLTCPLHMWTYDKDGTLLGEPAGFYSKPPCLKVSQPFQWNGLLWDTKPDIDLESIPHKEYLNPENYVFHSAHSEEYDFSWEIFVEIVLDSYHVTAVHPGLSNFVDMNSYSQISGHGFAYQSTKLTKDLSANPSKNFSAWQNHIVNNYPDRFEFASMWLVLYPNVMIEYYPGTCIVGSIYPTEKGCRFLYEFYYHDDIMAFDTEFIKLQQASYNEACAEDEEVCKKIQLGRYDVSKCYTHSLEKQIDHWYQYLKEKTYVSVS
jgi:choline monooxygenase